MLRTTMTAALCGFCLASSGYGAIDIKEWSGAGSGYTIHDEETIEIWAAGTYYFQSYDGSSPAKIENIWVNASVSGTVTIYIAQDPNDWVEGVEGPGASNLWEMNIDYNTAIPPDDINGVIGKMWLSGSIGRIGSGVQKILADSADGEIKVGGTIIDGDALEVHTPGDVTIEGVLVNPVQGNIKIANDYSGTLTINHSFSGDLMIGDPNDPNAAANLAGSISISGVNTGLVNVTGDSSGTISIGSNLNAPGRIVIDGDVSQSDPNVPVIHIGGGVVGSSASATPIVIGGELDGVLAIDGPLENVAPSAVEIQVGSLDTENLGAIAIDYDGWEDADDWAEGAVIKVDTNEYTENAPAAKVYRISKCKGDLDNDRGLDSTDQDLLDLSLAAYAEDYAGLRGSYDYHADVDNDTYVTSADADALEWLVDEGCEYCMAYDQLGDCNSDINEDGAVNLFDLAELLGHYGTTTGAGHEDGDVDPPYGGDGDVDLQDLAEFLGHYGVENGDSHRFRWRCRVGGPPFAPQRMGARFDWVAMPRRGFRPATSAGWPCAVARFEVAKERGSRMDTRRRLLFFSSGLPADCRH